MPPQRPFSPTSNRILFAWFHHSTPLIMASGRELCYVLLAGILFCYLMAVPILAKPSVLTCAILRIGLGFALCLCYSAILTKTNRISRIFNRGAKGIKRPSYTSPKSQIVICCGKSVFHENGLFSVGCEHHNIRWQRLDQMFESRPLLLRRSIYADITTAPIFTLYDLRHYMADALFPSC